MIRKKCAGYRYEEDEKDWSVTTDYVCENMYLNEPDDNSDIDAIENYGKAIIRAVKDFRKDTI